MGTTEIIIHLLPLLASTCNVVQCYCAVVGSSEIMVNLSPTETTNYWDLICGEFRDHKRPLGGK